MNLHNICKYPLFSYIAFEISQIIMINAAFICVNHDLYMCM